MKVADIYIRNGVLLSLIFNVLITVQTGAVAALLFIQLFFLHLGKVSEVRLAFFLVRNLKKTHKTELNVNYNDHFINHWQLIKLTVVHLCGP